MQYKPVYGVEMNSELDIRLLKRVAFRLEAWQGLRLIPAASFLIAQGFIRKTDNPGFIRLELLLALICAGVYLFVSRWYGINFGVAKQSRESIRFEIQESTKMTIFSVLLTPFMFKQTHLGGIFTLEMSVFFMWMYFRTRGDQYLRSYLWVGIGLFIASFFPTFFPDGLITGDTAKFLFKDSSDGSWGFISTQFLIIGFACGFLGVFAHRNYLKVLRKLGGLT